MLQLEEASRDLEGAKQVMAKMEAQAEEAEVGIQEALAALRMSMEEKIEEAKRDAETANRECKAAKEALVTQVRVVLSHPHLHPHHPYPRRRKHLQH